MLTIEDALATLTNDEYQLWRDWDLAWLTAYKVACCLIYDADYEARR